MLEGTTGTGMSESLILQGIPVGKAGGSHRLLMNLHDIVRNRGIDRVTLPESDEMISQVVKRNLDLATVYLPDALTGPTVLPKLTELNFLLINLRYDYLGGVPTPELVEHVKSMQFCLDRSPGFLLKPSLDQLIKGEYINLVSFYKQWYLLNFGI